MKVTYKEVKELGVKSIDAVVGEIYGIDDGCANLSGVYMIVKDYQNVKGLINLETGSSQTLNSVRDDACFVPRRAQLVIAK